MDVWCRLHLETKVLILNLRDGLRVEAGAIDAERGELAGEAGSVESGDVYADAGEIGIAGLNDGIADAGEDVSCLLILQTKLELIDGAAVAGVEARIDRYCAER